MINPLMVDFNPLELTELGQYGMKFCKTIWNLGDGELPLEDASVVFFNASYLDQLSTTVHLHESKKVRALLDQGSAVFVFLGECQTFQLRNLIGIPSDIQILGPGQRVPPAVIQELVNIDGPAGPLARIFELHGNLVSKAPALSYRHDPSIEVIPFLRNAQGTTGLMASVGKGRCVYLPYFGRMQTVVGTILRDVVPSLSPHLVEDEEFKWLNEKDYLMPSLVEVRAQQELAASLYQEKTRLLGEQYAAEFEKTQAPWNELLSKSGDALKEAVKRALEAFGWHVVDVDEYWKNSSTPNRQREEDLWIGDGPDPEPTQPHIALAEVKGKERGTASDDDYGAVVKYLHRRAREFKQTELRGMLVINHSYLVPPPARRPAFSDRVIGDSVHDNVVLVTTWDLFCLGKRLLAGTATAQEIRAILSKPGPVNI